MSSPVYLLRHSESCISPALYSPEESVHSLRIVTSQLENQSTLGIAGFVQRGLQEKLSNEERITYRQLLELLLTAEKVVTL